MYLFPEYCPVCMEPVMPKGRLIHKECERSLSFIKSPFCIKCGRQLTDTEEACCSTCRNSNFFFDMGRCTFPYRTVIQTALKELKNNGTREFAEFFGVMSVRRHKEFLENASPEVIVPVPMHKRKLLAKGFNQADLLANVISKHTGIPVQSIIRKNRATKDQKNLSGRERRDNLKNVFSVRIPEGTMMPSSVLIVDDIFTTGSTVNACAYALKQAGVERVYYICIAAGTTDN